jgi:GNAT superfamily N-acetyltransferase
MALWDIYLTPSKWSRPELSWLGGHDKERTEKLIAPLWDAREKYWLGERYLYCHVIAVHPAYQRRGVGQMLLKYGIDVAHQTRLPIYIESSRDGTRLYEKMGCRKLRMRPEPQTELSMSENCAEKGNNEATLFVWCPKSEEGSLPKGIELA